MGRRASDAFEEGRQTPPLNLLLLPLLLRCIAPAMVTRKHGRALAVVNDGGCECDGAVWMNSRLRCWLVAANTNDAMRIPNSPLILLLSPAAAAVGTLATAASAIVVAAQQDARRAPQRRRHRVAQRGRLLIERHRREHAARGQVLGGLRHGLADVEAVQPRRLDGGDASPVFEVRVEVNIIKGSQVQNLCATKHTTKKTRTHRVTAPSSGP